MIRTNFYLVFSKKRRPFGAIAVRATDRQPSLAAGEVSISVAAELPEALFTRPALRARIAIPDNAAPPAIDATVTNNIADAVRTALGIDLAISAEPAEGV